jgi:hypothetical protein
VRGVASPNLCCSESVRQSSWSRLLSPSAVTPCILFFRFMLVVLRVGVRWMEIMESSGVGLDSRREKGIRDVVDVRAWGCWSI